MPLYGYECCSVASFSFHATCLSWPCPIFCPPLPPLGSLCHWLYGILCTCSIICSTDISWQACISMKTLIGKVKQQRMEMCMSMSHIPSSNWVTKLLEKYLYHQRMVSFPFFYALQLLHPRLV